MKKLAVLICACIITQMASSQSLIIDDSVKLKKGIYKTYEEFKYNLPSIPLEWEVKWRLFDYSLAGSNILQAVLTDTVYNLEIEKIKTEEIGSIWGFCDGNSVYINREFSAFSGKVIFKPNSKFFKLLLIDRYCYFVSAFPGGMNGSYIHLVCAIDFNTGELKEINKKRLEKILSKDKELLQEYNNEEFIDTRADMTYYKYLKLYSEKHRDEIKER